jgi:hypothetical protein
MATARSQFFGNADPASADDGGWDSPNGFIWDSSVDDKPTVSRSDLFKGNYKPDKSVEDTDSPLIKSGKFILNNLYGGVETVGYEAAHAATGMAGGLVDTVTGLNRTPEDVEREKAGKPPKKWSADWWHDKAHDVLDESMKGYYPETPAGQAQAQAVDTGLGYLSWPLQKLAQGSTWLNGGTPRDEANLTSMLGMSLAKAGPNPYARAATNGARAGEAAAAATEHPAEVTAGGNASVGAAEAPPDLTGVSPDVAKAIRRAHEDGTVNREIRDRHIDAEQLLRPDDPNAPKFTLSEGEASGDAQQLSDERNFRTDKDTQDPEGNLRLVKHQQDNATALANSITELRRQTNPGGVQYSTAEHENSAIHAIKESDNGLLAGIRQAYDDMEKSNNGLIVDEPAFKDWHDKVVDQLTRERKLNTSEAQTVVKYIEDEMKSNPTLDSVGHEGIRTQLAEWARKGGSLGHAAGVAYDHLMEAPVASAEGGVARDLATKARDLYKKRQNIIKQNPAYKAVVNDGVEKVNGLHDLTEDSPLANDKNGFFDKYFMGNKTSATPEYVRRMTSMFKNNPQFMDSLRSGVLNRLRDAAGIDAESNQLKNGFNAATFDSTVTGLRSKFKSIFDAPTQEHIERTRRNANLANASPSGEYINRSATALAQERAGSIETGQAQPGAGAITVGKMVDAGTNTLLSRTHPAIGVAKNIYDTFRGAKNAENEAAQAAAAEQAHANRISAIKRQFVDDALAPAAGVNTPSR